LRAPARFVIDDAKTSLRTSRGCRIATWSATLAPLLNPKEVRLLDVEVSQERRYVVGRTFERDGAGAIARASVPLLLDRDDLVVLRQDREHLGERDVDRRPTAVQQHEGHAVRAAVHLVVHLDSVDRRAPALDHALTLLRCSARGAAQDRKRCREREREPRRHGVQLSETLFVRLNVEIVQNAAALRYQI
jgi:hypothetical protein